MAASVGLATHNLITDAAHYLKAMFLQTLTRFSSDAGSVIKLAVVNVISRERLIALATANCYYQPRAGRKRGSVCKNHVLRGACDVAPFFLWMMQSISSRTAIIRSD